MLKSLFGYESHVQMVRDVYRKDCISEEKLSKLITYMKSRTSCIPSVLDDLCGKIEEEMQSTHRLKTGSRVLRLIIDQLRDVSICYESRMLKIFVGIVKKILVLKKMGIFEYSDHQEFLDVFRYFFETVPIRTHESDKYIRKILFIAASVTRATVDLKVSSRHNEELLVFLSDDGMDDGREMDGYSEDSEESNIIGLSEETGSEEMSGMKFEYLFLEVIHSLMSVENVLRAGYNEKYRWLVNSLMKPGEVNDAKKMEILEMVGKKANEIGGSSFVYYVLRYGSVMKRSCLDILTRCLESNLYPQVILQANVNILEQKRRVEERNEIYECEFLVREVVGFLSGHEIVHLDQKEIVWSLLHVLRMFFSNGYQPEFEFVILYVRVYFEKCMRISDVFYGFLKKMYEGDGLCTADLRGVILSEIERYLLRNSGCIFDARFVSYLLSPPTNDAMPAHCRILYLSRDGFMRMAAKPLMREKIMGKLRLLLYRSGSVDAHNLVVEIVRSEVFRSDRYKMLCLMNERRMLSEVWMRDVYIENYIEINEMIDKECGGRYLEEYDFEEDRMIYEECLAKPNQRCENVCKGRRKSRISLIDYENHFR
ncbi:hypothetical protein CWI40_020360 [Ordospora colligata]|nr:hypothetical protein CWI40_020360 [Ordospora colligata]